MMPLLVYLVLLQCARVSVIPLLRYSFRPAADLAGRVSLMELNRHAGSPYLFRVNRRLVQRISEVGLNTFDLDLRFGAKKTACSVGMEHVLDRCAYMWGAAAVSGTCTSRVRVSGTYSLLLSLHCVTDSSNGASSSSSSSEEVELIRVKAPPSANVPGIVLCKGAARCAKLLW